MSGGLNGDQKQALRFVGHMVTNVETFNSERYFELETEYKKQDPDVYHVLHTSRVKAEREYDQFLDKKVLNLGGVFGIGFESIETGKDCVLGKVVDKMRTQVFSDQEFRNKFLAPSISRTAIEYDRSLKKSFKELERERSLEGKEKKRFSIGWNF